MSQTIQPTITQQVRAFLADQDVDLAPWSGLDETYGELYALLNRRKEDATFWPGVELLLNRIMRGALDPGSPDRLPAPQAELLASWDVESLTAELRAALPGGAVDPAPSTLHSFTSRISAAVMGGFLLLGLAAASGCSDDTDSPAMDTGLPLDAGADRAPPVPDAPIFPDTGPWFAKCNLAKSSVLYQAIESSAISEPAKASLCGCFEALNKSWADGLTQLFQTGTAKEIADALKHMITCCGGKKSELNSDYAQVKGDFLKSRLCKGVPIYKGVSFPR